VGDFDIELPVAGTAGIECRTGGDFNTYNLVFQFSGNVSVPGTATKTQGTAVVGLPIRGSNANEVIVPLRGVTNVQHLIVNLSGVQNSIGQIINNQVARMDVLIGDVNASRRTDATDVTIVRGQTVQTTTQANCRYDVNASGRIDSTDVTITRGQSVTALPPPP
jgi:hypothetical protein